MNCELAFERILEADPDDLVPESQSELGLHIAGCERCRAVAHEILAGQQALGDAVRSLEAEGKVDAVIRGVHAAARARRRRMAARVALLPLAAAAAFALLVTGNGGRTPVPSAMESEGVFGSPSVTLPPATNAMVLKTDNPKISVVWFY